MESDNKKAKFEGDYGVVSPALISPAALVRSFPCRMSVAYTTHCDSWPWPIASGLSLGILRVKVGIPLSSLFCCACSQMVAVKLAE